MQKIIIHLVALLWVAGCTHQIDITQGNVVTQTKVEQLKTGMEKRQVLFLLGTPLLNDPFHQARWDYFYSHKPGGKETAAHYRLSLYFDGERLDRFTTHGEIPAQPLLIGKP